ncbi:molybdate ABC transporter substrate-binding protein [Parabacteroides sp. FAFU027]|uniref:molybdate ABC transporter substrate-binding protein n=1 Tax=Parabacteroides sp. FAFU027 TaxID=2922715 RepID=UPI001FAF9F41|nr:molybdate ABC transporter substrate-binding protein [Parabacteroides sp. FAFU027]
MKRITLLLIAALAIQLSATAQKVRIAAAADLRYAMDKVVELYKQKKPGADIQVTYGSSGNAFQQISNGAEYELYFSADISYPKRLKELGFTISKPKLYAIGYLTLWSNTIDLKAGMNAVLDSKVSKIAIANPEHAPYGKRAEECLKYYKLYDKIKEKLILGDNISQTAQYVTSGNAEIGFIALSLTCAPAMKGKGKYLLIDSKSHSPLKQAFVMLKPAKNNKLAYDFAKFVSMPDARNIFKNFGFRLPSEKESIVE